MRVSTVIIARLFGAAGPAAAACAFLLAAAPASAGEIRATLSVAAVVAPSCRVGRRPAATAEIACSTGASVSTWVAARADERPLDEAATMLGAPVRSDGRVRFTSAAPGPVPAAAAGGDATRYLTITY